MLRMIRPDLLPRLTAMVGAFEGGGLAGDFDNQVASWGPFQWNIGQGTLLPLLRRIAELDLTRMQAILGPDLVAALTDNETLTRFFRERVLVANNPARARPEYVRAFATLANTVAARQAFSEHSAVYADRAARDAARLGFVTERGIALTLDIAVQNGGIRTARNPLGLENSHLDRFWGTCQAHHHPEWERMRILAHVVADMANPRWRENVRARKIAIAVGNGRVHGRDYILERDFGIRYWSNREARIPATWHATPHFGA